MHPNPFDPDAFDWSDWLDFGATQDLQSDAQIGGEVG